MGFNTIETPGIPGGDENQKIDGLYRYLVRMADELNIQLGKIGSNDLTDEERQVMMDVIRETSGPAGQEAEYLDGAAQMESLKSLIVKTAKFVQTKLQEYRTSLLRETVAEGQFGRYVRNTGLDVIVNPEGVTQNFTFREIVQGLRNFEIFSKNYIKTGLLRTEGQLPVYGLQIGKDIVTFSQDGEETYHDGNKAIEVLADAINFFSSQNQVMQIKNGLIDCSGDMKIRAGGTFEVDSTNFLIDSVNKLLKAGNWLLSDVGINLTKTDTVSGYGQTITATTKFKILNSNAIPANESNCGIRYDYVLAGTYDWQTQQFGASFSPVITLFGTVSTIKSNEITYKTPIELLFKFNHNYNAIRIQPSRNLGASLGESDYQFSYSYIDEGFFRYINCSEAFYYNNILQNSSRYIKHDIIPLEPVGEKLDQLEPVTFVYDDDAEEKKRFGLIYEDTVEVLPEICTGDESNKAINYVELIPMLLKEIQELRARVKALEERGGEA